MKIQRRQLIQAAIVGGLGTLGVSQLVRSSSAQKPVAASDNRYAQQVDEGLDYFRKMAQRQLPLCTSMLAAIGSGNLQKAKDTYVEARPPYEQIEVLAVSFEQTDADIDARPYAFDGGEADPEFRGFHKIEAFLYRDEDLRSALPYAQTLVESVETLMQDLNQRQNFSAQLHFEGMISLATEVAAKKISSEEETWSDQSLLIFKENWNGIYSQYKPFIPVVAECRMFNHDFNRYPNLLNPAQ